VCFYIRDEKASKGALTENGTASGKVKVKIFIDFDRRLKMRRDNTVRK
jgi:hypothetical protein